MSQCFSICAVRIYRILFNCPSITLQSSVRYRTLFSAKLNSTVSWIQHIYIIVNKSLSTQIFRTLLVRFSIKSHTRCFITVTLNAFSVYRRHTRRVVIKVFSFFFHLTFMYTIVLLFYLSSPTPPLFPTLSSCPPPAGLRLQIFISPTHYIIRTRIIPLPNEIRLYVSSS